MSSYIKNLKNPKTGKMQKAGCIDDWFEHYVYGYFFPKDGGDFDWEKHFHKDKEKDCDIYEWGEIEAGEVIPKPPTDKRKELFENLADKQHDIWSHWMVYMFSQCTKLEGGDIVIPKNKVERWERQLNNPYKALSENEKESDREQVMKFWGLIKE